MNEPKRKRGPKGDLASYTRREFSGAGYTRAVYQKGSGPAVIVIAEMPGITPRVIGFADRVAALGCSVSLPDLFGEAGRDPMKGGPISNAAYALGTIARACISREFSIFAAGRSSPIVDFLRALAKQEHARCAGPGVGVVGMCFTGGFALSMALDPEVIAPVLAEPSLPFPITKSRAASIDCSPEALAQVAQRCQREGLRVLGLRFQDDPIVPAERFAHLRQHLGDGFLAVELPQSSGHPRGPMPKHHSVLTEDLIDEPGEPTLDALQRVLDLFRDRLLTPAAAAHATS